MNNLFFVAVSFGLLMALEKKGREDVSLKTFSRLIKRGVQVSVLGALLALVAYGILSRLPWRPVREGEFLILLLLPLGYQVYPMQRNSRAFYLAVTAFAFFAAEKAASFWDCVYFCALLGGVSTLFQVLLEGLKSRLAFAPPPSRVEGLAFLFFITSLVALALHFIVLYL